MGVLQQALISARTVGGGGGAGDFDYTNLLWRVRAADIGGLSDGDPISTWSDTSGNGRHWASDGTHKPLYQTNELNGHPVVEFRGPTNQDHFIGPDLSSGITEIDLYIVLKAASDPPSNVNQVGLWFLTPMSSSFFSLTEWPATDGAIKDAAFNVGTGSDRLVADPAASLTSWRLYRLTPKTGTNNFKMYLDGTTLETRTFPTLGFPSLTYLGRASWNSGGSNSYWIGKVAEFFAFSTVCGSTQYGTIRDYVNSFYALSVT